MADLLFHLPPVRQRRPRSYGYNDSILAYSDQELRARYEFAEHLIFPNRTNQFYVAASVFLTVDEKIALWDTNRR